MKPFSLIIISSALGIMSSPLFAQKPNSNTADNNHAVKHLYIDVHHVGPGKITNEAVAVAHEKDLAVEKKYGVEFIKYWVDTAKGNVYCLSSSTDTMGIVKTHGEAHGLLPDHIYMVTDGIEASQIGGKELFLDVHELGAGSVKASDKEMALLNARDVYGRRNEGINIWVIPAEAITASTPEDVGSFFDPANDKIYRHPNFYKMPQGIKSI